MTEAPQVSQHSEESQPPRRVRPHYEGDPTMFKVMRSPKWILAFLFAIAVAGGFAWLGQWQLENAIRIDNEQTFDKEAMRPLTELSAPGEPVKDGIGGRIVTTEGSFVPGDFTLIENRTNSGEIGVWVAGHLQTTDPDPMGHLSVAIGWAPNREIALDALQLLDQQHTDQNLLLEGRYMPTEGPVRPAADQTADLVTTMSPAQQVNLWQPFDGSAYAGYLVMHPSEAVALAQIGLDPIDSVPPLPVETINWVSVFYAAEWVVFAGFAIFFWHRLVRDDWEKRHELKELQEAEGGAGGA